MNGAPGHIRVNGDWAPQTHPDRSPGDFGRTIAISGDTILVAVYVYQRSGATWQQQAILTTGVTNGPNRKWL